jgi:thiamine-phosphate pyrophosphorylase
LEGLRAIRKAVRIPIVWIAGITPKNYQQVLAVGADGAAVVSGILGADDISETVTAFLAGR